jgi:tetratricopeptide (TPR) repeat protein
MSIPVTTALNAGLQAHRAGNLDKAIAVYCAVLDLAPDNPKARHLRGFALLQADRAADALSDLQLAVGSSPDNGTAWTHLAICQERLGHLGAPAARRAVALNPAAPEALDLLVREQTVDTRALSWLLVLAPDDASAWNRAGLERAPYAPSLATAHFRRALCLAPTAASIALDLAEVERRTQHPETALARINRTLALRPNDPRALADRAGAEIELDAVGDALSDTRRAAVQDPASRAAWGNRAEALYRLSRYPEALKYGTRARVTAPADPDAMANLAVYRLANGDLAGGWWLFRQRRARRTTPGPALPRWSGEPEANLLVLAEQGLGDELLFSTLWQDLDRRVADGRLASATVEADERLITLGARALHNLNWKPRQGAQAGISGASHWCLAGDLLEMFRQDRESFASSAPGLVPDPDRVDQWRRWLARVAGARPTIGLCWRSGSRAGHRRRHYPTLGECDPLLALENYFFVALQYDDCAAELAEASVGQGTAIVLPPDLDRRDDQEGLAALMAALDIVVSADTAVLALAGALGVPAVAISLHRGWVGLGQEQHPWFPRMSRVYRPPGVPWRETMTSVARTVERLLAGRT